MPSGTPPGPEAALKYRAMLHKAFPNLRVKIEDIIAKGDRVTVRASWTGTHRGLLPIMPVPVTNRAFAFTGMVFWRVGDGKIVERWTTLDRLGLHVRFSN
jgi:predicted ester cyclase